MMNALDNLVKWIGIFNHSDWIFNAFQSDLHFCIPTIKTAVVSTVSALVGMIPEGLYLLTTAALVVRRYAPRKAQNSGARNGLH
ncbi:MAG: hypothetical protein L6V93_08910 [Clostridiales bacterium]|nr:MAG: hypothetical protein L6V93_08910 [Clostridiales bacterium]